MTPFRLPTPPRWMSQKKQDINNLDLDFPKPIAMRQRNQRLFANIPPEIIIEILSKLPVRSIISCKCVCKSWLALLESREFVKSHRLKAMPGLVLYRSGLKMYNFFDFEDGFDREHHELHYKPITKFNIPGSEGWISGSANGLLFLCDMSMCERNHEALHICNPITREYIELDCSEFSNTYYTSIITYGFGSSKISGQYKVVRIFKKYVPTPEGSPVHVVSSSECVCHVYTIGTGLWRQISPVSNLEFSHHSIGTFLNGNLHWPAEDFVGWPQLWISCFDLETESFSVFSSPLKKEALLVGPYVLEDCLCLCDNSLVGGIDIWLMKEYEVEKYWTKQYFIVYERSPEAEFYSYDVVYPIKIFKDGDILLAREPHDFLLYSKKNNTVQKLETFGREYISAFLFTPSFLSLKNSGVENVVSF